MAKAMMKLSLLRHIVERQRKNNARDYEAFIERHSNDDEVDLADILSN